MRPATRRLAFLSAAVIAVLAVVLAVALPLGTASALTGPAARNGVGASHPAMILAVGASHAVLAVQGRGEAGPQARFVSGACVATEEGANAAATAARNFQFGDLNGSLGETDLRTGEITIQRGLTGRVFDETLRHETVHSVLTPSNSLLNSGRAWLYQSSQLWRFAEEGAAETYATGSLSRGLAFPLGEHGITVPRLGAEILGVGAAAGDAAYGLYEAGQ
jgi:hypothetical protein